MGKVFLLSKFFQMFLSLRVLGFWSTVSVFLRCGDVSRAV